MNPETMIWQRFRQFKNSTAGRWILSAIAIATYYVLIFRFGPKLVPEVVQPMVTVIYDGSNKEVRAYLAMVLLVIATLALFLPAVLPAVGGRAKTKEMILQDLETTKAALNKAVAYLIDLERDIVRRAEEDQRSATSLRNLKTANEAEAEKLNRTLEAIGFGNSRRRSFATHTASFVVGVLSSLVASLIWAAGQ